LNDKQVDKLNENLEYAIKNMEISLSDIREGYLEEENT